MKYERLSVHIFDAALHKNRAIIYRKKKTNHGAWGSSFTAYVDCCCCFFVFLLEDIFFKSVQEAASVSCTQNASPFSKNVKRVGLLIPAESHEGFRPFLYVAFPSHCLQWVKGLFVLYFLMFFFLQAPGTHSIFLFIAL